MYIAFKWLLCLAFTMWLAMCSIDAFVKNNIIMAEKGNNKIRALITMNLMKNASISAPSPMHAHLKQINRVGDSSHNMAYIHFFMFVAGAVVVMLYNKFNDIIFISKYELTQIVKTADPIHFPKHIKLIAVIIRQYFIEYCKKLLASLQYIMCKLRNALCKFVYKSHQKQKINFILLKKMKEINEEKKNLAQLLLTALRENKNIRIQYQLENVAKKRLMQHIECTEKLLQENKSRYVSFQKLYLVTHQENCLLKDQIKKISSDKEEIEKKIIGLISEIYKSKNRELMSFCCQFIVQAKFNLLNSDVNAEIQKFLYRPRQARASMGQWPVELSENPEMEALGSNSCLRCSSASNITGLLESKELEQLPSEAPKLKGLPGECVWTVKDKNGLIEKLYECDFSSNEDYGDTIRRIREYSVYHDKDCLLDLSDSTNNLMCTSRASLMEIGRYTNVDSNNKLRNQKFLTDSELFKKFMQDSNRVGNKTMLISKTRIQPE